MNIQELGQRVVLCKHWRWIPGMRYWEPHRVKAWEGEPRFLRMVDRPGHTTTDSDARDQAAYSGCLPDLRDPATLGCLFALVREACDGLVDFTEFYDSNGVYVCELAFQDHYGQGPVFRAGSLAEVLIAALEAVP